MADTLLVLYVDDEIGLLEIGKTFLEHTGNFSVETINSATAALGLIKSKQFDAIVSDYQMPGMDGIEFLKKVRSSGNTIPFILFTGRGREEVVIQALNEGADFYLQKGGEPKSQFAELTYKVRQAVSLKRAQRKISDLASIVENSDDAIIGKSLQGIITSWNAGAEKIYGYPASEVIGQSISLLIPVDKEDDLDTILQKVSRGEPVYHYETKRRRKDGRVIDVSLTSSPIKDQNGSIIGVSTIARDISERKRAEEEMRFKNTILVTQQEATLDGILIVDNVGKILNFNQNFINIWGIPHESIQSRDDKPVLQYVVGQLTNPDAFLSRVRYLYANREEKSFDELLLRDGRILERFSAPILGNSGKYYGRVWYFRDITERKHAEQALNENEQRLASIFNAVEDVLFQLTIGPDEQYRFTSVNSAFSRITGLPPEQVIGRNVKEVIPEPSLSLVLKKYQQAIEKKAIIRWEETTSYPIGQLIGEVSIAPIFDEVGTCTHLIGSVHDITERKQAEMALKMSDSYYRAIFETSLYGIVHTGPDLKFVRVNDMFCSIMEYSREDLIGKMGIGDITHPDDIADSQKQMMLLIRHEQERFMVEKRYLTRNGRVIQAMVFVVAVFNSEGGYLGASASIMDITERKRSEDALRESEEKFRSLAESSPDYIMRYDRQCRHTYMNPAALRVSGLVKERIIGKTHRESGFDEIMSLFWEEKITQVFETGKPHQTQFVWRSVEGSVVLDWMLTPEFADDGTVRSVLGVSRDISQLKLAEEELLKKNEELNASYEEITAAEEELRVNLDTLTKQEVAMRESEEKFHSLFVHMIEGAALHELTFDDKGVPEDYVIIETNPAFEIQLGISRENVIGKTSRVVYGVSDPPYLDIYKQVALTGKPEVFETYFPPLDKHFSISVYCPAKGRFATIFEDITDRKRAEQVLKKSEIQLNQVMDLAHIVNWEFDVATGMFTFDDRFYSLYGTTSELEGGSQMSADDYARKFVYPGDRHMVADEVKKSIQAVDPGYVSEVEHRIIRRDGEIRHIVVRFGITKDKNGRTTKTHGANQDITELKRAEESLKAANKKLNLLSGLTRHDINNQLLALNGFLGLLHRKAQNPTLEDYFTRITKASGRISSMIEFTREYEMIGVNTPTWQNCHILVETAAKEAPLGQVIVKNDLPIGTEVFADPMIFKVFYNLIENAVRHGVTITTIRFYVEESGNKKQIVCENDGVGIPNEEKEKIFERGFGKNTGLGLFLSREILSITGITIKETDEPGKGARFEIVVPNGMFRNENIIPYPG